MKRGIAAFERQWQYDASYLHEIVEVSPGGVDVLPCGSPSIGPSGEAS